MPAQDHRISVDNGKYTFVIDANGYISVQRHGAPWIDHADAPSAIHAALCELDAARVVVAAVRACAQAGTAPPEIVTALKTHAGLVGDHEPPSAWTRP